MIDKETRAQHLKDAEAKVKEFAQEDTIGGVLAFLASSPFSDTDTAEYMIHALVATSTPEALAKAYNITDAAATVLHSAAVANVTTKKRPPKNGQSALLKVLAGILSASAGKADPEAKPAADDKPAEECQCAGCKLGRIVQNLKAGGVATESDGMTTVAFQFDAKSPEDAVEINARFQAEVAAGRNPLEVMQELGGRIANPEEVERAAKAGKATVHHMDLSGKPIQPN